ncbi:MAG: ComEC/Rec2 family competence protein [Acutalibacteraceae bacterium]
MNKIKRKLPLIAVSILLIIGVALSISEALGIPVFGNLNGIFTVQYKNSCKQGLYVHFIDVGCADSVLITENNNNILIDCGNASLRSRSLEYLKDNNIKSLDLLILSHTDKDHIGSAQDIIDKINVNKIIYPIKAENESEDDSVLTSLISRAESLNIPYSELTAPQHLKVGDLTLHILSPLKQYKASNDTSLVIRMEYKNTSFLFTGDAQKAEYDILESGADIKSDVLKVAHHGSKTSTGDGFLKAVSPEYAVISVGNNIYGLPSYEIIDKIEQTGAKVLRTDKSGSIVFYSDGEKLTVFKEEKEN